MTKTQLTTHSTNITEEAFSYNQLPHQKQQVQSIQLLQGEPLKDIKA